VRAAQAAEPGTTEITVQTGAANGPAKALYRSEGFAEVGERVVVPGLVVTALRKRRTPAR
jgi:ribosomal protein S18 acetylase RimI-like enzyme